MRIKRRVPIALALGAMVGAGLLLAPSTAFAADLPYDGTDPHYTGCDSSAFTAPGSPVNGAGGSVELRYSTSCGTAWARFTCQSWNGCTNYSLWVRRNNDGKV